MGCGSSTAQRDPKDPQRAAKDPSPRALEAQEQEHKPPTPPQPTQEQSISPPPQPGQPELQQGSSPSQQEQRREDPPVAGSQSGDAAQDQPQSAASLDDDVRIASDGVGQPPAAGTPNPLPPAPQPGSAEPSLEQAPPPPSSSLLLSSPRPSVDVTSRGVTLGYLLRLAASGDVDPSWTIQDLVDNYVRPQSRGTKCCLFDLVPEQHSGAPRFFVSHTWSRKLSVLVQMLQEHLTASSAAPADELLWLDVFAINQHPYEDRGCLLNEDVASLSKVVAATEQTLFCLDLECVALTRIWCLFEVWHTFLGHGVGGLMVLMSEVNVTKLTGIFETFDVKSSQATQPADKADILRSIEESIGATQVNLQLKAALVGSAVHHAKQYAAEGGAEGAAGTAEAASLLDRAAGMLQADGKFDEAQPLFEKALEVRSKLLGYEHPEFLRTLTNLGQCLMQRGGEAVAQAEACFNQVLASRTRVLGADHLDTLESITNLALLQMKQGRFHAATGKAEEGLRKALEGWTKALGADHPDSIAALGNLARCVDIMGRREEAMLIYKQALDAKIRVLGPDHPSTLSSAYQLAVLTNALGRLAEAELLFRQALEAWMRVYGPDHPSTLANVTSLAGCVGRQGRYDEAEVLYRQVLESRTRLLGPEHENTGDAIYALACLFQAAGRKDEARASYLAAAGVYAVAIGPTFTKTLNAKMAAEEVDW